MQQHKLTKLIQSLLCTVILMASGSHLRADNDVKITEKYLEHLILTGLLNDPTGEITETLLILQSPFLPAGSFADALIQLQPSWFGDLAWSTENTLTNASRTISDNILTRTWEYQKSSVCERYNNKVPFRNFWIAGQGGYLRQNKIENLPAFRSDDWAIVGGLDFVLADWISIGIAAGFTHTNLKWREMNGRNSIHTYYIGPYFSWNCGNWVVEASILRGAQRYRSDRHIQFAFINREAKNTHYGDSILCHLGTTLNYNWGVYEFTPYLMADYIYINEHGIKEKGAHHFDLRVRSTQPQFFQGEVGATFSAAYNINCVIVVPSVRIGFQNITPIDDTKLTANWRFQPGHFTVKTTKEPIYQWTAGALLNLYMQNCPELIFSFNCEGGDKRWAYNASGEINWSF